MNASRGITVHAAHHAIGSVPLVLSMLILTRGNGGQEVVDCPSIDVTRSGQMLVNGAAAT